MDILSIWPVIMAASLAVGLAVVATAWWGASDTGWRRVGSTLSRLLIVLLSQACAVAAVGLQINREYEFYTTWSEAAGVQNRSGTMVADPLPGQHAVRITKVKISKRNPHPAGLLRQVDVPGMSAPFHQASVYLPAAYFERGQEETHFPVVVIVGGMGMTGTKLARMLGAVAMNSDVINRHKASPFIAVYVPGTISSGIDSECLDVPGAAQATYLTRTIPDLVRSRFRASADTSRWFIAGWSTGGLCAALMTARHPDVYHAGAALAPYYHPIFNNPAQVPDAAALASGNNLVTMVRSGRLRHLRLLSITSQRDAQSWGPADQRPVNGQFPPDARVFRDVSRKLPGSAMFVLKEGGHNTDTYFPQFPRALTWLGTQGL